MQGSSFDFDVISGPSLPRDTRQPVQGADRPQPQPAGTAPAAPRNR
jgi:hypothetical protein